MTDQGSRLRRKMFTGRTLLLPGLVAGLVTITIMLVQLVVLGASELLTMALMALIVTYGLCFALWVTTRLAGALRNPRSIPAPSLDDPDLPRYSILMPLFRESEVFPGIVRAPGSLKGPADELEILFLLEEDDHQMLDVARRAEAAALWLRPLG